jgi:hypothetical protein
MLLFSMFMVSVFAITSDMNQNIVFFNNLPKDVNGHVLPKCFICKEHGADTSLINRFGNDIHSQCYDPILEIEPAYAKAIHLMLKKNNPDLEFDTLQHKAQRKSLITFAFDKVKASNHKSFKEYSDKNGKIPLESLFWQGFVTQLHAKPFDNVCDWNLQQLYPSTFIPEGNENILK